MYTRMYMIYHTVIYHKLLFSGLYERAALIQYHA